MQSFGNQLFDITISGMEQELWRYRLCASSAGYAIAPPAFEIDGELRTVVLADIAEVQAPQVLSNGCTEYSFAGSLVGDADLSLEMVFRVAEENPVVRFRYVLKSNSSRQLTKVTGKDQLRYLGVSLADLPQVKEVRLSVFNEMVHSYCPDEVEIAPRHFEDRQRVMGPLVTASGEQGSMLFAYEHGSQYPDAFVEFRLSPDRSVEVCAVKGNYCRDQVVDAEHPYSSLWLQFVAVAGTEAELADAYRTFVLKYLTLNQASRQPYIFYNTWAYQERNQAWNGMKYLDSMQQERMLQEIEVAHQMGIDVFVLDTGWYEKTGDWRVNLSRFPDGLQAVKDKLDAYGMKLGLWFSPTEAAVSSAMVRNHPDCAMSWHGEEYPAHPVWETEESKRMCLVSRYWEAFADELIRLVREVGVTYFKWDAIGQYGCDDLRHDHGGEALTGEERADSYAFQQVQAMGRVIDRLCEACPEVIVDFDVTEGNRCVGLGFLASGKYFLINNGPYYGNYNIPIPPTQWCNIFVYPGPARTWICRTPLAYDKWVPSVLFLTHYLPDDPAESQLINIASLILGQNGIWGDLLAVSDEGVARFGTLLRLYKQVREDITASSPIRTGMVGGSPEVHEKISPAGRGAVVIFANAPATYRYLTAHLVDACSWTTEGATVKLDAAGRAEITCTFNKAGAMVIFFGVEA